MKKYHKGELAKEILKGLAIGGFIVSCVVFPGFAQVATLFKARSGTEQSRIKQSIRRLAQKKFVRVYEKDGMDVVEITERGKKKILQFELDDLAIQKTKQWDHLWRAIIFDIPESRKRARTAISYKIKEMGMYPLQKSTFISPYPCKKEVDFIGEYYNVRKHIIYMEVGEIDTSAKLKAIFKL